ncbi:MAG: PEP-CTERM sorting domain-containing protein [Sedimentisphaerales bacterium]|nr:PEP-CTERM sorting domain-containing protein [Sedimentisphaerales bacterium]
MIRKVLKIMLLLLLMPMLCRATSLTFTEDGTITSGTYDDVTIMDTATVGMSGGDVSRMYVQNLGILNYSGGTIGQTELRDAAKLNLEGASLTGLKLFNSNIFNLNSGTFDGTFEMYEYSEINVNGGQVVNADLQSYNFGITDIYAGDVTWEGVDLYQHSVLNIYGGDVLFNDGFWLDDDAGINVFYSSIIRLKPEDPYSEIIGYNLRDGGEFMLDQFAQSEIDQINFVPEPTTLLLLGLGGLLLRKRK